ncbi:nicotinamide-nucleotide amidohydrolase family protein [bacterium]|nr:nicotinamide-nucleotide amidohydrolase family protein [bacterium]
MKKKFAGGVTRTRLLKVVGLNEPAVDKKLRDISKTRENLEIGLIAHPTEVEIRITARGPAGNEDSLSGLISQAEAKVRERLGDYIFGVDEETLEKVVGVLLSLRHKTIGVAESCTGGLISHRLTNVPGSSNYFLHSVVAYSPEAKMNILKVRQEKLNKFGAVSPQVSQEMAEGIRSLSRSDIGLAVTGIAGPGGTTQKKPVGLVYIALAGDDSNSTEEHHFSGSREMIKEKASQAALDLVRKHLLKE